MKIGKIVDIECKCGFLLFRYFKAGKGRIIKCFVDRMEKDFVGLKGLPTFFKPVCPNCNNEIGILMMIRGSIAIKLNQGCIKSIRL
ncbi:MAG TPA: hypothetical protein PKJ08_12545 [Candidatus Cloacimonadota bacterium]|jgi:hypothetical protein|nr:hypothetical protein [Candidatus Cloacimonadota bacterium]HOD55348.1 hypothetical protein [Candidatus Cloacimonadota bacterium]HPM01081.1 hypothetical protein [Candidatus Cloacimonadota bacterium]